MDLMRDLAISPQLEALLRKSKDIQPVHTPRRNLKPENARALMEYEASDLPNNIDSFPFSKYVAKYFNDASQWGVLSNVLRSALTTTVASMDQKAAITLNRLILRIMIDKNYTGGDLKLFCDYIVARILMNYHMRDEALCQLASLTWKNYDEAKNKRLWVLLSHCLSCVMPSSHLYNYLFKYVSDHGNGGYECVLQQKLLRMPRNQSQDEGRLYPPSVLEWQTNNARAPMAIMINLPNGNAVPVEVNSWTTAEDAANRAIESITGGTAQGWSLLLLREDKSITEISGHDYIFDLISKLEIFPGLETQPDGFINYGANTERPANFNPSEFLEPEESSQNPRREVPVDVLHDPSSSDGKNESAGLNSNFSFGPPNIRLSNNAQGQRRPQHQIDPETGGVAGRIKGGGKMMNGMGVPMQPQMMMQQPQMMPMQGMMQQPMMQQPMMQQPMMQQPMMQQPMMQQPMMQQPMMQQPMMQQPMMQQPMMRQPSLMQSQMSMPYQQSMGMPGSIGMLANAMDTPDQQSQMLRQMKMLIQKQEEQQKKAEENLRQTRTRNYRDFDDDYRRPRRNDRHSRDYSSDENRRPSRRRRSRRDSSEEDRRRSHRTRSRHDSEGDDQRKKDSASTDIKKTDDKKIGDDDHKKTSPKKEEKEKILLHKSPDSTPLKKSVKDSDESDATTEIVSGQGTVRMSFKQKRNFFEQGKAALKNEPPPRGPPKLIALPKAEEKAPQHPKKEEKKIKEDSDNESETDVIPLKKDPEKEAADTHAEALKLIEAAKRKSKKESKDRNMDAALLARQRREAAGKQTNSTKSPITEDPPFKAAPTRKLTPKRITPVRPQPIVLPKPEQMDSSSEDSPEIVSRDQSISALEMALAARRMNSRREGEQQEPTPPSPSPPTPPPVPPPPIPEESQPPPLPPFIQDEDLRPVYQSMPTDVNTQTVVHPKPSGAPMTYTNVQWKLYVRKEIFFTGDHVKNDKMETYLVKQIFREAKAGNPRILPEDRDQVLDYIQNIPKRDPPKNIILKNAMEKWPIYFTRIFSIKVTDAASGLPNTLYQANSIGIGMTGVHFIIVHASVRWKIQTYQFSSISQIKEQGTDIGFQIDGMKVTMSCRKSIELGRTLRPYMIAPFPKSPTSPTQQTPEESEEGNYQDFEQDKQEVIYDVVAPPPKGSNLTLLQYGLQYFARKKDVDKQLMYSKGTLSKPLHEISDQTLTADSLKCYRAIQQFMGDAQAKSPLEQLPKEILGICYKHRRIVIDEVTIYLAKQTTNNKKNDSLMKGWRLFSVFLAFFKCSDLLLPYLLAHLHDIASTGDEISRGAATVCQVHLQQTMNYGGRKHMPSVIEIRTLLKGHVTSDQSFFIPGFNDVKFQMNTSTVIADAVRHFCGMLGIKSEEAMKEFGVFKIIMDKNDKFLDIVPQTRNVYLLDIMSTAVKENQKFVLSFQRVVWKQPINYDNEKLVATLFHQVVSEYADGKYLTFKDLTENPSQAQIAEYSKMSGLIHRGCGESSLPTLDQVKYYIPNKVIGVKTDYVWKESVHNDFMSIQQMSPAAARSEVLALLSNKRMFGASFFTIEVGNVNDQMTKLKLMAINPTALFLVEIDNHRIEREILLSKIEEVSLQQNEIGSVGIINISISGSQPLRLRSRKAAVVTGVLNHHIHI